MKSPAILVQQPVRRPLSVLKVFSLFAYFAYFAVPLFAAPSPLLIPFQGRLTNPQGVPYTNGQYTVIFNLYDQPVGGTVLWNETHQKVGVINGMVNVFLGSINPLTGVDFSQTRHLGITIDADGNANTPDPEMVPRQMIIPAFYAKNAEKLNGYDWTPVFGANNPNLPLPGTKLQNNSITAGQIAPQTITAAQIASNTITSGQLGGAIITSNQIVNGSISSLNLAPGSVLNTNLADGQITLNKLASRQVGTNVGVGGVAFSLVSSMSDTTSSSALTLIPNMQVTIVTSGRPVFLTIVGVETNTDSYLRIITPNGGTTSQVDIAAFRGDQCIGIQYWQGYVGINAYFNFQVPTTQISFIDFPPAGTNTYTLKFQTDSTSTFKLVRGHLIAWEL